jgi:hypothetical protein
VVLDQTGFSCPGFLTQILSDSSLYAPALSAPFNSRYKKPDQQKPGNDGRKNEQIKNLFRHCFGRQLEQCRGRYAAGEKRRRLGEKFRKISKMEASEWPSSMVRNSNGRINPGDG